MRINYKSHPGIKVVETGSFQAFHTAQTKVAMMEVQKKFEREKGMFKSVNIISDTMMKVIESTGGRMVDYKLWDQFGTCAGSIILGNLTVCYSISDTNKKYDADSKIPFFDYTIYVFLENVLLGHAAQDVKKEIRVAMATDTFKGMALAMIPDSIKDNAKNPDFWREAVMDVFYMNVIRCVNFMRYADTQDKFVSANTGKKKKHNYSITNETNLDIHYITSDYITNLYVAGAFKVEGHWRMQPKKVDGVWTKELIWINQYDKEGYTRKAGILTSPAV